MGKGWWSTKWEGGVASKVLPLQKGVRRFRFSHTEWGINQHEAPMRMGLLCSGI